MVVIQHTTQNVGKIGKKNQILCLEFLWIIFLWWWPKRDWKFNITEESKYFRRNCLLPEYLSTHSRNGHNPTKTKTYNTCIIVRQRSTVIPFHLCTVAEYLYNFKDFRESEKSNHLLSHAMKLNWVPKSTKIWWQTSLLTDVYRTDANWKTSLWGNSSQKTATFISK